MKQKTMKIMIFSVFILAFATIAWKMNNVISNAQEEDYNNTTTDIEIEYILGLEDGQFLNYLKTNGLDIPLEFQSNPNTAKFIKTVISQVEQNPNIEFLYNYYVTCEFAESIKKFVKQRYDIEQQYNDLYSAENKNRDVVLQYNTLYSPWESDCNNYNCYSYAINYRENDFYADRGRYPGQMSNETFTLSMSISAMAQLVKNDLIAIGYQDVFVTSIKPDILCPGESLICIRKSNDNTDYHFMKYNQTGNYWTHKPGSSAILQYNYQPSNSLYWYGEGVFQDGPMLIPNLVYDSDIYYIVYNWAGFEFDSTELIAFVPPTNFNGVTTVPYGTTSIGDYAFYNCTTLTSITLPSSVTVIGENAFKGCTGLMETVLLPTNIISIGVNAFENCVNLTSIFNFNSIVSIGAQAFKGCSSLTNISIPAGTTSIGAGAFAGCCNLNISVLSSNPNYSASGNILYNKTGSVINSACNISDTITIPSTVTEISPYAFYDNDNLEALHIYGAPTIGLSAFANCENLTDVYCYSDTVPTLGLSAFSNDTFTLYTPYSKQSQYVTAFVGYVNTASSIPITISFSSDGTVIDTLNTYFGANITGLINPSKTGYNFAGWYDNIAYTGTVYTNGGLWDTTSNMTVYAKWSPQTYYIYFTGYGSENLADKEVTYDALIGTMPSVSRTGYTFYGWKNQYNEYFTSDMIWQKLSNQTVSSDLRANQYTITYNGNGGTANAQSQSVYYDGVISAFASAYREGYTFTGWNTNANGSGQTFTAPFTYVIDDNTTLYAQYTANEYNVTFDKQGGTGGSDGVNATYNSPMPSGTSITAPTKNGYTFLGYYRYADGLGTKYYNADMTSANIWNLSDDTTLFAYWSANQYTVTLDQQNGAGGTNSVNATYNAAMPSGANITAPTRTGYTFQGYFQYVNGSGTKYYNSDMTSHNVWNVAGNSTVYAHWTPNTYNISLQLEGGINGTTIVQATYNAPMNSAVAPTRVGYTFQGYYSLSGGSGTKYYNADMSSAHVWDIADNGTLYAYWLGNQFTVTFNKQDGSGGTTSAIVVYGSAMPAGLTAPTRSLYVFMGYYDDTTEDSIMYYDSNMVSTHNWDKLTNATLYAHWRGVYFNITYSNLTFLNQTANVLLDNYNYAPTYYEYNVGLDLTRISAFYPSSSPYSPQLRFLGWYNSLDFDTQVTSISALRTGTVTVYAKWRYDYDNPSRYGTYTINNADPLNQTYYDQQYIGLGYNNLYQNLINIGITKLTFSFKLRSWGEGTQHIFVYNESGTQLDSTTFSSTSSATVHPHQFTINLSSLGSSNYIYIRYQADTYWSWFQYKSRYWYCDYLYMEMSYVVNESDFYNPEFYWHYQDPFD